LRQDLTQEALIHLWRVERERPGQTTSWYLQSCRFCLQHYLASGKSVDSIKRRAAQVPLFEEDSEAAEMFEQFTGECRELSHACARDIVSSISRRLKPKERAVLHCLADGLSTRDIAKRLNLSSPTVTKYRRNIAGFAAKLGIAKAGGCNALVHFRLASAAPPRNDPGSSQKATKETKIRSVLRSLEIRSRRDFCNILAIFDEVCDRVCDEVSL